MSTKTAPSVARKLATQARRIAEGVPAGKRGRPRREEKSASLYVTSFRLSPDEHETASRLAKKHGMALGPWFRHAGTNETGSAPAPAPVVVEMPSKIDAEFARSLAGIANNANQLARAWNTAVNLIGKGNALTADDLANLKATADRLNALIVPLSAVEKPAGSRIAAATKLVLGIKR